MTMAQCPGRWSRRDLETGSVLLDAAGRRVATLGRTPPLAEWHLIGGTLAQVLHQVAVVQAYVEDREELDRAEPTKS